jgi:hypothetical protein
MHLRGALFTALGSVVLACGNPSLPVQCVPGQSIACHGVAGCLGGQICKADGTGFGPCLCAEDLRLDAGGGDTTAAPAPDATVVAPADTGAPPDLPAFTAPDAAPDTAAPLPHPAFAACHSLGIQSLEDVETKFIAPRCGAGSACHQAVFPPRNLHMPAMIRTALVGRKSATLCKNDFYIDPSFPERSHFLATVTPLGPKVTCPSGGEGGTRMPNSMPAVAGPRLKDAEIACLTWYVWQVARGQDPP